MASAPQGFRSRVKDRVTKERAKVAFYLETTDEDENGEEFVVRRDDFVATAPTDEQLMLLMAVGGREDSSIGDEASAMLDFFKAALPADQYKVLLGRLRDPDDPDVDAESLGEIFQWLMERFQDFPTTQPSASSGSQGSSGARSTGRVRGKGSTR